MKSLFWSSLLKGLDSQRISTTANKNLYLNPLINDIYLRESAFACNALKVDFLTTGNIESSKKLDSTVSAIFNYLNSPGSLGFCEPVIGTRSYKMKKGSIPVSIIFVHALDQAIGFEQTNLNLDVVNLKNLVNSCQIRSGAYSHDKISQESKTPPVVLNTTAMVGYFYSRFDDVTSSVHLNEIIYYLKSHQRDDGLWPYCGSRKFDKFVWNTKGILNTKLIKVYEFIRNDKSIFFGDYLHHVVTLYYLVCALENKPELLSSVRHSLQLGLNFISNNSLAEDNKTLLVYDWEPKLNKIRHCNFYDTSAYFYLLALLSKLSKIDPQLANLLPNPISYLSYIEQKFWNPVDNSVNPYTTTDQTVLDKIICRPAESIFDKIFLLSIYMENLL